ncbi:MAG TPA: TlyA family RNA methyltransferase [Patescibacteria group bacterium]|nr:TlyA family RNA methyltransferase [Patescibacteria group bacterium]
MKKRLDMLVFEKGLADSREKAQRLIMAGSISLNGKKETKPGSRFDEDAKIEVVEKQRYVGRGAEKLGKAANVFQIDFKGKTVADIGSSTGGFTDFALQHGAKKVFAIDVGRGQLAWTLRNDKRVVVMEETNFKDVKELPERIDIFVIDVSFISVKRILENISKYFKIFNNIQIILLFKPQFEAGKAIADKYKGVIKDPDIHESLLADFRLWCIENGFEIRGEVESPIKGSKGNTEFLFHLKII